MNILIARQLTIFSIVMLLYPYLKAYCKHLSTLDCCRFFSGWIAN